MRVAIARAFVVVGVAALAVGVTMACSSFSDDGEATPADGGDTDAKTSDDAAPPTDAAARIDADDAGMESGPPPKYALTCGLATCVLVDSGRQDCCYTPNVPIESTFGCANAPDQCPSLPHSKRYSCDDPEDCAAFGLVGNVCCAKLAQNADGDTRYFMQEARCVAKENCAGPYLVRRCNPTVSGECGATNSCIEWTNVRDVADASQTVAPAFYGCKL